MPNMAAVVIKIGHGFFDRLRTLMGIKPCYSSKISYRGLGGLILLIRVIRGSYFLTNSSEL